MKYAKTYRSKNEARAELQRRREAGDQVVLDAYIDIVNGKTIIGYLVKEVQA